MPMLSLELTGPRIDVSPEQLADLRQQLRRDHYVRFPGFLSAPVLDAVARRMDDNGFRHLTHATLDGSESRLSGGAPTAILLLLMNSPALLSFVEKLCERSPIDTFKGRIYRFEPSSSQHFDWHDDMIDDRPLAASINLGLQPCAGGELQFREEGSEHILARVPNPGYGDAVFFEVIAGLEHRVTNVTGTVAKTAFSGWFSPGKSMIEELKAGGRAVLPAD